MLALTAMDASDCAAQIFKRKKNSAPVKTDSTATAPTQAATPKERSKDSLFVTLERTPCFGHCPSYKIEIYYKGFVAYHGYNYVDHVGDFFTVVSRGKLKELFDYAKEIKYFNMKDSYINPAITDFPTTITSMQVRGQKKVIVDGHHETPSELVFFEKMIDDMFKDTQWKPLSEAK
jgi:hypothetical protein